ncbi:MAG: hypothetical protein IJI61_07395 [Oscillospiraceae bacterium]|nr:hypothetical protein [Oscillospiraceae bacterium]
MYKKQIKLQKAACLFALAASVLLFLYSLGIMTDLYESLYFTIRNPDNPARNPVAGALIYYDMQGFNRQFLHVGLAMILVSCLLFITGTHSRRRYYFGNVFAVGLHAAVGIAAVLWARAQILVYKAQYLAEVDFEALKDFSEKRNTYFTDSTFWFDIHTLVFAIVIIANVLLIANLIWKFSMMKQEKQLIEAGKGATA